MTNVNELLNLPTETLVVLGAGYVGYNIACTGRDKTYKASDTIFISLAFGLFAKLAWISLDAWNIYWQTIGAFTLSILSAVLWRKWLSDFTFDTLRWLQVSNSDKHMTAWDRIAVSTKHKPGQLVVRKCSGEVLMCDDLFSVKDLPHGPCLYGSDGSIAMYVTHFKSAKSETWQDAEFNDPDYGASLTYIPASQIAEIENRY